MKLKKIVIGISLPLFLSSLLFSQSITEVAKKERERRARLKGLKAVVVTNADLRKVRKRPALDTSRIVVPPSVSTPPDRSSDIDTAEPSGRRAPTKQAPGIDTQEPGQSSVEQAEANYFKAKEYTQLLTIKLRGLWQEYYSMDDTSDRGGIQKQIAETSLQVEKAKRDEAVAKKEMEDAQRAVRRKKP